MASIKCTFDQLVRDARWWKAEHLKWIRIYQTSVTYGNVFHVHTRYEASRLCGYELPRHQHERHRRCLAYYENRRRNAARRYYAALYEVQEFIRQVDLAYGSSPVQMPVSLLV